MKETAVGIVFFIFVGILLYFTIAVKGVSLVGGGTSTTFDVLFKNAEYLKKGHPVVFGGQKVGKVQSVRFDEEKNRIRVTVEVSGIRIPDNAKITIVSSTLFGGKALSISRPDIRSVSYIEDGGTYEGVQKKGLMDSLQDLSNNLNSTLGDIRKDLVRTMDNAQKATKSLAEITEKINRGKGTLGRLVNDSEMGDNLKAVTRNLQRVTDKLAQGQGTLGRLIGDKQMGDNMKRITSNLAGITEKINTGHGTLGKFIEDSVVYRNLAAISTKIDKMMAKILSGDGTLGKLLNDEKLYNNLTGTASNVRTITQDIVEQKGLLGRAVSDGKMGENFADTLQNLKDASQSIKNIASKIDTGSGTLGDLVNNRELIDSAKSALANLDKTLGRAARAETVVGMGYFFYDKQKLTAAKGYIRLMPSKGRYFHLGATLFFPSKKGPIGFDQAKQDKGNLLIYPDILVAQKWYMNDTNAESWDDVALTIRLGMLEGQLGGGIDIDFLDNFRLTVEARTTHKDASKFHENINRYLARAYVSYRFVKYFRAYVGIDNFVENGAFTFGLSTEWYDKDVKTLVSLIGSAGNL